MYCFRLLLIRTLVITSGVFVCSGFMNLGFAKENNYRHFQSEKRFPYEIALFKLAMGKVDSTATLSLHSENVNYGRGMTLLAQDEIDFAFFAANDDLEKQFQAIKIPILNGILGYRLNLVHRDNVNKFRNVTTLGALNEQYKAGFNSHWPDKVVLEANNMPTYYSTSYENLFSMLEAKRFNYFPRGINEIWTERKAQRRIAPSIIVEPHIAFWYPYPVYFFVNKNNSELARKLQEGLTIALNDGSFMEWFTLYHKPFIKRANIANRRVIELVNPMLPKDFDTASFDLSWRNAN